MIGLLVIYILPLIFVAKIFSNLEYRYKIKNLYYTFTGLGAYLISFLVSLYIISAMTIKNFPDKDWEDIFIKNYIWYFVICMALSTFITYLYYIYSERKIINNDKN